MAEQDDPNPYNLRERKFPKLKSVSRKSEHAKANRKQRQTAQNWYGRYADDVQLSSSDDEKSRPTKSSKPKTKKQTIKSADSTTSQKYFTPPSELAHADPVDVFTGPRDSQSPDNHAPGFQSPTDSGAPAEPDITTAHHAPTAVDVTQLNDPDHAPVDLAQAADATAQHNTDLRKPDRALEFDSSEHHGARPKIYPARFIFPTDEQREQFEETDGAHASAHPPVAPFLRPPLFQFYATYTSPRRSSAELFRGQARRTQDIQPHPQPGPRDSDSEAEHAVQLIGFRTRQDSNSQTSEGEGQQGHAPRNRTNTSEGHISDHSGDTSDHRGDSSDSTDHSDTDSFLTDDDHRDIMANNRLLAAVATRPELFDGKKPEKAQQWWNSVDRYAAFSEIAGEHKARLVGMMFKGIALHWYEGLPAATQTDINLLTQAF